MSRENPEMATKPEIRARLDEFKQLLASGVPVKIDVETGIVVGIESSQIAVRLENFRFLPRAPDDAFDTSATKWADRTVGPVEAGDVNDLIMFGHNALWNPGQPSGDMEAVLLNVKSGQTWRIPIESAQAGTGCFLPGRKSVVVTGVDQASGQMGLYVVDLVTRENRKIGSPLLDGVLCISPTLSTDGKSVAVSYKGSGGGGGDKVLDFRIALVDVATGAARPIGQPEDAAFVNWLPDGSGLLLMRRTYKDLREQATETIIRMDLKGNVTPIRPGNSPLVLGDDRLLFRDQPSDLWLTCDLAGKNEKRLGDGLPHHSFPTGSPDGTRVLMMKFVKGRAPQPVIVTLADGTEQDVHVGDGLWGMPAWR
jgi:hypothetical protein